MFILFLLYFCKNSWQYFVLLLFFLYELFFHYILFYLSIFGINKIINMLLFCLYFLFNIFSIYFIFYFYLCLYYFFVSVFFFKMFLHMFVDQQNIFILFFILFCYLFLFKLNFYLSFYLIKILVTLLYFKISNSYKIGFKNYLNNDISFFYFWRNLTNFLRLKHYKASIFFLYTVYIIIIANLLFMNFNPVA